MTALETAVGYADAAGVYLDAGWNPIPVDPASPRGKSGIPTGVTGYRGRLVTVDDVERWSRTRGADKLAIRLPSGVVGFDVDDYDGKVGDTNLQALEVEIGPLPPTWASSV